MKIKKGQIFVPFYYTETTMNKLFYIIFFLSIGFSGYDIGDTISQNDLDQNFNTCFGDISAVSFGDYENNSVIWLNLSASW